MPRPPMASLERGGEEMSNEISLEEKLKLLVSKLGGGNRLLYNIYKDSDEGTKRRIIKTMAGYYQELESVIDDYGFKRDPEGIARLMLLSENLIGCEPRGELLSTTPDEAIRKVTFCPWAESFSNDGGTCRLLFAALEEWISKKYGLQIHCEQSIAEGAEYCIWKVSRNRHSL